jgi:hypothetical protein
LSFGLLDSVLPGSAGRARDNEGASKKGYRQRWGLIAAAQHFLVQNLRCRLGLRLYGVFLRPIVPPSGPPPNVPGVTIRLFTRGDAKALLACAKRPELDLTEDFVRTALAKGDLCAAALIDGQIVAFAWSASTPTHDHKGVYTAYGDRHRYGYFSFTLPEYRGLHLPRLWAPLRDEYHRSIGHTHLVSYISIDNRSLMHMAAAVASASRAT